ncbi:methyl-accepting chemotaxis protein [Guyparkeria hydrothermalis]|uniref:methyl-accepting chemotaxis protein n=1 Tax=Guyparkeria hydrothermalis TaxID=923 RepID=UPI0020200A1D|nr:methyl-accepting chemotaxis protein [Guyparkeria hydrothermalis]MCL7750381.1 methyl-accepting chemotaxis protein [Guyparkeria hydrothermalis]
MKVNLPVTQHNVDYPADMQLISTTDLKGQITYVNQDFIKVSGYAWDELIGRPHNLIRHPDMPPAAFKDLWQTIKAGRVWHQLVKNRCKNGDHYWVDAYVTPVYAGDEIVGYQSIRTKPSEADIAKAEACYRWMNEKKVESLPKKRRLADLSLFHVTLVVLGLLGLVQLNELLAPDWMNDALASSLPVIELLLTVGLGLLLWRGVFRPLALTSTILRRIAGGKLRQPIHVSGENEIGRINQSAKLLQARLSTVFGQFTESALSLTASADQLSATGAQTSQRMDQQTREVEQVATAMNEMAQTVEEVAHSAARTAETVERADREAHGGKEQVRRTHAAVEELSGQFERTAESIESLREHGDRIDSIIQVIGGIADQTNLLALNAAIEAARAGEHGRGFAVVAEEVRSLASKTQDSAGEIREMIETLRQGIQSAVDSVEQGRGRMDEVEQQAGATDRALDSITEAVDEISQMSTQIATATEQQSAVAEEMSRNITSISGETEETTENSREVADAGQALSAMAADLQALLAQFNTDASATFDFASARAAHLAWKTRLRAYLAGDHDALDADNIASDHDCQLGRWYFGQGKRKYGDLPAMAAIEEPHRQLHQKVKQIIDLDRNGDKAQAERELTAVDRLSDRIVSLLDEVERGTQAA